MEYEAVIGLETHVQLKTKSKMWCGCANAFGSPPNTNVCPVCLGLPGVLPVPNDEALRLTVLTGFLLNCEIPRFAKFDRKSYFYPDMPKNYQITQYDKPSTANGWVEFEFNGGLSRVRITRAHLEEDVGKNSHFERKSGVEFRAIRQAVHGQRLGRVRIQRRAIARAHHPRAPGGGRGQEFAFRAQKRRGIPSGTTSRPRPTAGSSSNSTAGYRACASPARTWRRTWARIRISSATAAWTSTAPAYRSWKSFPSRTSPVPTWPTNISTRSRTFWFMAA